MGICTLCEPGYAETTKRLNGVSRQEKEDLLHKLKKFEKEDPDYEEKIKKLKEELKTTKGNKGTNHYDEQLDEELRDYGRRKDNVGFVYVECKKCKEGCVHCYDDMICTECSDKYKLVNGNCMKLNEEGRRREAGKCKKRSNNGKWCFDCPEGENFSFSQGKCVTCPENCSSCSTSALCNSCKTGYKLANGYCKLCNVPGCLNCHESSRTCLECMKGFYFSLITQRCEKCHSSCAECSGPQENDCFSCRFKDLKVEYNYENVPSAIAQKQLHNFELRFPEYAQMPMLQSFILHPNHDAFCKEYCDNPDELHKTQGVFESHREFTNECPIVHGPHPQEIHGISDEVKTEYGQHHSDDEAEKEYDHDVHKRGQRERLRKHVEKELSKEGFQRHTDAVNRHHIGRKEYKNLVDDIKEKQKAQVEDENKEREEYLKTQVPHRPPNADDRTEDSVTHEKGFHSKHVVHEVEESNEFEHQEYNGGPRPPSPPPKMAKPTLIKNESGIDL